MKSKMVFLGSILRNWKLAYTSHPFFKCFSTHFRTFSRVANLQCSYSTSYARPCSFLPISDLVYMKTTHSLQFLTQKHMFQACGMHFTAVPNYYHSLSTILGYRTCFQDLRHKFRSFMKMSVEGCLVLERETVKTKRGRVISQNFLYTIYFIYFGQLLFIYIIYLILLHQ